MSAIRSFKIVAGYIIIGIVGTIIATAGASTLQIWQVRKVISRTDALLRGNSVEAALGQLYQAEYWASRYPVLEVQLNMATIKCHVKRQDMMTAGETARKILDGKFAKARPSRNLFEIIQNIPNYIIIKAWDDNKLNCYSGYEELVNAVRQSGNYPRLVSVSKEIISIDPNSTLARSVKNYIPVESVAAQPVAATNKVEQAPPPTDHRKLLENYVAQKDWEKALNECNILLGASPDDQSVIGLRKLALVKGKRWAVVTAANAPSYNASGRFMKGMPAGYVLDVIDIIKASREELAMCSAIVGTSSETNFLVRTRDTVVHIGDFRKLSEESQKLFSRRLDISSQIASLRTKLTTTVVESKNPHTAEYKAAKQAHETYWAQVRELQKKRDDSSTSYDDRMRLSDELRKMKGEDIRLGMALEEAKKKYDEASRKNNLNIHSPELASLEKELADIQGKIKLLD